MEKSGHAFARLIKCLQYFNPTQLAAPNPSQAANPETLVENQLPELKWVKVSEVQI